MENNNISNEEWERLCKRCGKCCHCKYNLIIFAVADPEYVCKNLTTDNRCEVYESRLKQKGCMSLKTAIKKDRLIPKGCGYIHVNPKHETIIFPETMEEFWKLVELAQMILSQKFETKKEVSLIDFIRKTRENLKEFKLKTTG